MSFEPQKFFIGLIDFFSVIMPGAVLVYLGQPLFFALLGIADPAPSDGSERWVLFLFESYLLGHVVYLIGSVLDDLIYAPIRTATEWSQITDRLASGRPLSPAWLRRLVAWPWMYGRHPDRAVMQVERLRARALGAIAADNTLNAFQWSKARLQVDLKEGLLAVQRFEADSKFFRSFVVVLVVLAVLFALNRSFAYALISLVAVIPALWRYADQRFKSTQQAYWFVIVLESARKDAPKPPPRPDGLTHAGGVLFRIQDGAPQFLLVQATKDRTQWVLPKGHIEPGEHPRVTAVREVREETGALGRVVGYLDDTSFENDQGTVAVRWFLLELAEAGRKVEAEDRQAAWLSLDEARQRASFPETRDLLDKAARLHEALKAEKERHGHQTR